MNKLKYSIVAIFRDGHHETYYGDRPDSFVEKLEELDKRNTYIRTLPERAANDPYRFDTHWSHSFSHLKVVTVFLTEVTPDPMFDLSIDDIKMNWITPDALTNYTKAIRARDKELKGT